MTPTTGVRDGAPAGGYDAPIAADDTEAQWVAAGLYDPGAKGAADRLALLRWVAEHGATVDQMVAAEAEGRLNSVIGELVLRPGPRVTPRELAGRLGVAVEAVGELRRAAGLPAIDPDDAQLTEDDVRMFEVLQAAAAAFSREELLRLLTVIGSSLRRIADAAGEMFLRDVEAPLKASGEVGDLDWARSSLAGSEHARAATAVFAPLFLAHLEVSTRRTRSVRLGSEDGVTVSLAIGFVDLSGFTERAGRLSAAELHELIVAFEARANTVVGEHDGRVVKLIGDEVMFSAVDASSACSIALALTAAAPDGTTARGGVAAGPVLASGGDLYGPVVNLASRIADIAVPDEVLVDEAVVASVADRTFEPAGRRALKGFTDPVPLWSVTG